VARSAAARSPGPDDEQVERWRDADNSVWDEPIPGLLDRLVQPRARRQAEPELEAE